MDILEGLIDLAGYRTSCLALVVMLALALVGAGVGLALGWSGRSYLARRVSLGLWIGVPVALVCSAVAFTVIGLECRVDALAKPPTHPRPYTAAELDQRARQDRIDQARLVLIFLNPGLLLWAGAAVRWRARPRPPPEVKPVA